MRIINQKSEISKIGSPKQLHCTFFVSFRDAFGILSHAPFLEVLEVPESHKKNISENTKKLLELNNIELRFESRQGTRTDIEGI